MRMRTQRQAIQIIREADPDTAITPHALRMMILSKKIPSVMAGGKYLIDVDRLEEYITAPEPEPVIEIGRIRAVKE